ncbi:hypothetical protein [Flavobacterium sp. AED]|uniref:hypothetical protein n=1 Tax=Flavobacterium sp. AED TaxID=1423323 RepID=UPI00057DCDE1|nr:hypothetical protein [Flavobacterium sp. AED]KIA86584.1 hypothetical protein OA85_02740 [Flavobacterium sp. AED]
MSKYFKTSDGQNFYQENDAKNHAKTLEDKTVTPPSDEAIAEMEVVGAKDETGEAPKEIKLSKMTKAQLVAFAVDNELTIDETATNAVIVESIEVQLTEKNQA